MAMQIADLKLNRDSKIVVLTGAGVSAESGIPTFRDAMEGLWENYDPEELASMKGFRKNPQLVYEWYQWRRNKVLKSQPNKAHFNISKWQKIFRNFLLITQNVDGLHNVAGSDNFIELHGNIHRMKCLNIGHSSLWVDSSSVPTCEICGGMLRPDIVWFGEAINKADLERIRRNLADCDLFIAIGTSGQVFPAAGFLAEAKKSGAKTIVINPDPEAGIGEDIFLRGSATRETDKLLDLFESLK